MTVSEFLIFFALCTDKVSSVLLHKPAGSLHAEVLTELLEMNIHYVSCLSMILGEFVMKECVGEKGNFILSFCKTLINGFKSR